MPDSQNGKMRTYLLMFMMGLLTVLFGGCLIHLENRISGFGLEQASRKTRIDNLERDIQKLKTFHERPVDN